MKTAVRRNRIKRILRECLRTYKTHTTFSIKVIKNPLEQEGLFLRKDFELCIHTFK